jgi:hypothetical protein
MTPPTCRLCNEQHWPAQGCDFDLQLSRLSNAPKPSARVAKDHATPNAKRQSKWRQAHPEKHRAVQKAWRDSKKMEG